MASNASSAAALLRRVQRPQDMWRLQLSRLENVVPQCGQSNSSRDGGGGGGGTAPTRKTSDYKNERDF